MVSEKCNEAYEKHYKLMLEALDEVAPHNKTLYFSVRGWLRSFFEAGFDAGRVGIDFMDSKLAETEHKGN